MSAMTTRDRCDSLPSTRNRTPSECSNHSITNSSMPPPRTIPSLNQQSTHRPHSMYTRHSHSPPMNTLSPSTGCSESEGSSLSIDEPDSICQSSTPDESGNFTARYYRWVFFLSFLFDIFISIEIVTRNPSISIHGTKKKCG